MRRGRREGQENKAKKEERGFEVLCIEYIRQHGV